MTDIAGIDVARIEIRLAQATVRTRPGSTIENPVTLVNLTPLPDFFYLAVSGNPTPWASFDKESVNLFPNWSDIINLTVSVPEETKPGSYVLGIEASSHTQDNVKSSINFEIVVEGSSGGHVAQAPGLDSLTHPAFGHTAEPPIPGLNPPGQQPVFQDPFAPPSDFPRLQIDLDSGLVTVVAGQTADQAAYLLNLSASPQNFNVGLEGLPPEWISVDPAHIRLSPNWSEVTRFKIAVPVDAIPGRYLLTARAIPESQPEAVAWRQFDIVILPPIPQGQPAAPDVAFPQNQTASTEGTGQHFGTEGSQPSKIMGAPETANEPAHFQSAPLPVPSSNGQASLSTPPTVPVISQPTPPVWGQQVMPDAAQAPEAPKAQAEPKQRTGLFGWRKKKAEHDPAEPILFVPIVSTEPNPVTPPAPTSAARQVTGQTDQQLFETAGGTPVKDLEPSPAIEDDSPTRQILPAPKTLSSEPEEAAPGIAETAISQPVKAVNGPGDILANNEAPTIINPPIDDAPTVHPHIQIEEPSTVNPPIDETPTVPPVAETGISEVVLEEHEEGGPAEAGVKVAEEPEEAGPPPEPAIVRNENIELNVENAKIRFELGKSYEQQVGLINLMANPAFFDLKVEGVPETWYNFSYSQINLFPNWREQVYFRLEAPTDTTPGLFKASLVVTSPNLPENRVEIPFEIEVLPSADLADKIYRATGAGLPVQLTADAKIELMVSTVNLTLEPENNLEQTIALVNHSPIPDLFELKLEGLLETWYQFSATHVNLFPNWQEELYLRIGLPSNAVPGLYPVRVLAKGQQYPELHAEQTLLLQVLPPSPKPEPVLEVNPAIGSEGDVDTVSHNKNLPQTEVESNTAVEPEVDGVDNGPAQTFSFASFFQQQHFVPGPVAQNQTPSPASAPAANSNLPVVPSAPEVTYNQPTSAIPAPFGTTNTPGVYPGFTPAPGTNYDPNQGNIQGPGVAPAPNSFEDRQTTRMSTPNVLAPQTSLAGIIPAITAQTEAPPPPPPIEEPAPLPVAAPRKRTLWQRITGQGKEPPAPVTPKIDENVLWRPAQNQNQNQTPARQQGQVGGAAGPEPLSAQSTQVNWKMPAANQAAPAGDYPAIGGAVATASPGQRAYSPISTGGDVARVQITLEKPHMTIVAGQNLTQQVFLMNMTSLPDNFELTIEGLPGNWFSFENSTVNLFPNWNEHTALTINISEKVKPDLYKGRIVASAKAQTGVRAVMPIEVEVLAPLVVQARLQPHRAKGYKADYEMLLRNRSMSQGLMTMQWAPTNSYTMGTFTPPQVVLAPGQSQQVKVQVMLRKKTPKDQARQLQPFKVMVQPQWTVAQVPVLTAPVNVDGEYIHRSRWVFIQRHPVLFTFLTIVLLIVLLWNLLLLPFIQNSLLALSLDKVTYTDIAAKTLVADQLGFNLRLKDANPIGAFVPTDVSFIEAPDKNPKGIVVVKMQAFVFTATLEGTLQVDPVSGDLKFVADKPSQLGSFPWFFIPPDKVVQKLSGKLKTWLKEQNPAQRLDDVYIEGNTLFLTLRNCQPGEIACK